MLIVPTGGVNGNLPNLDFLAAVSHITRFTGGVTPLVYNSSEAIITHRGPKGFFSHPLVKQYRAAASSVWQQIYWQALGAPSGPEGVYSRCDSRSHVTMMKSLIESLPIDSASMPWPSSPFQQRTRTASSLSEK